MAGRITLEKNGISLDFFPGEVSADRITTIQVNFLETSQLMMELMMDKGHTRLSCLERALGRVPRGVD